MYCYTTPYKYPSEQKYLAKYGREPKTYEIKQKTYKKVFCVHPPLLKLVQPISLCLPHFFAFCYSRLFVIIKKRARIVKAYEA